MRLFLFYIIMYIQYNKLNYIGVYIMKKWNEVKNIEINHKNIDSVIEALQQMKETIKDATVDLYIDDNCGGGYDAGSIRLYELDGNYMVEFSG